MTSKITYLGDLRTEAVHQLSGNKIITDAPPDNQGKGEAFSPTDLAATALGSCMMTIMAIAARDRGIDMDGATAEVTKKMALDPFRRIAGIEVRIFMPKGKKYSARERKLLETAAHGCPVSRSLSANLAEKVEIVWPD
mgnify:CR=1 FL=1